MKPALDSLAPVTPLSPEGLGDLFRRFDRIPWADLGLGDKAALSADDLGKVRALNDVIDLGEVAEIYVPVVGLLEDLGGRTTSARRGSPFIIGIGGSVAAGKSTTARLLQTLLAQGWPELTTDLVTTDGFLLPNRELERRGLMARKGFPESYDTLGLFHFLRDARNGVQELNVPEYSHLAYDLVPEHWQRVSHPDVLIVEGLSVLQAPAPGETKLHPFISDFFDYRIYVHARPEDLARWFTDRFLALKATAFQRPESFFNGYAGLTEPEARSFAAEVWNGINAPNLIQNIAPSMAGAQMILDKGPDHHIQAVWLRT